MTRTENLLRITKRLIILTCAGLLALAVFFGITYFFYERLMLSWLCFGCGLLGGFVSIQQRLKKIGNEELELLSKSWFQILLIPVYGGVFAEVLYVIFLAKIVQSDLFPQFVVPPFAAKPTIADIKALLDSTYPASGADFAKFLFWSFVAGFSERFVPQIIGKAEAGTGKTGE